MGVDPVVLSREQKYFDAAWEHRERMRQSLRGAAGAAANSGAAMHIKRDVQERLKQLGGPDDPVAFGRMDDEDGETLYLGKHAIFDDESELVVINWKTPAAARFYQATHADPLGLQFKREFQCSGNTIEAFEDTVFAQLAAEVEELEAYEEPNDALLADLESNRTGTMQDIVKTIQAAQFDLIRAPIDQLMVIQGGPGTGKTAVALHRVSWLLFNHRDRLPPHDVLIIGPNPTFTRYTRQVLPSLGDTSVQQLDINQLAPLVKRGRPEEPGVAKLKGDGRMAGLVRRALYARVGGLSDGQQRVEIQLDHRSFWLTSEDLGPLISRGRISTRTYAEGRQLFRDLLAELVADRARVITQRARAVLDPVVDRIWPSFTAASFLRELYGSRDRLMAAAGDEFTAREVSQLHRRSADRVSDETWSDADLAVLDEIEYLLHGGEQQFSHVVVDEAQDLSPMQLRSVARRSATGSMTIVGDIAQSTGHWARDDWDDVLRHLPIDLPHVRDELRYGYRVPRQVFELAAELLPIAAPTVRAPQVVRDGPADPAIHEIDDDKRAAQTVRVAMGHAAHGRSVAIICPTSCRDDIRQELTAKDVAWREAAKGELGPGVNLVSPQEAKGLEFDAVVVVEPQDIIAEDQRGHRLLYVALTRTTRYLDLVSTKAPAIPGGDDVVSQDVTDPTTAPTSTQDDDVPPANSRSDGQRSVGLPGSQPSPGVLSPSTSPVGGRSHRFVEVAAEEVVVLLRETVAPNLWRSVLARANEMLDSDT